MHKPKVLIFIQVLVVGLLAYDPEDVIFADPGNSVNLTCVSGVTRGTRLITWYRRREHDVWTVVKNGSGKSASRSEANITHLVIDNVTSQDFGKYYCAVLDGKAQVFSKGTTLTTRDISTSGSSIHLLTPFQSTAHSFPIRLACVVHAAVQQVYVIWKISGTHFKGKMISWQNPSGTWTILNTISLSSDNWKNGEIVTCEAWFTSTPVSVHWGKPQRDKTSSICQTWVITVCGLVLVLAIFTYYIYQHLKTSKMHKTSYKSRKSNGNNTDDILYTDLKIHSQTPGRRRM